MQLWQINILELQQTALGQVDEFIALHKLGVLIVLIYLVMAIGLGLIVLIRRGQRQNPQRRGIHVPPIILVERPTSPPPDTFDPFPPPHHYRRCDCDDHYPD